MQFRSSNHHYFLLFFTLVLLGLLPLIYYITKNPNRAEAGDPPIAHWAFNEGVDNTCLGGSNDACDGTGNGNDLARTNAVWQNEDFCIDGKCVFFDGSGDFFSRADDNDLDFDASDSFSITGWFRHPPIVTIPDYIVAKHGTTSSDGGYKVYMDSDGDIVCAIDDDDTFNPDASASSTNANYDDNQWHHFECVKDGTNSLTLNIDGNLITQNTSISGVGSLANSDTFYVGIDGDGSSNSWQGFLDEIKVYVYARSADEVKADAIVGADSGGASAVLGQPDNSFLSDGLVGYWNMDDNDIDSHSCPTGSTGDLCDRSGNNNHGTDVGSMTDSDYVGGKFGSALSFDGSDDSVSDNSLSFSQAADDPITLSAWFKSTTDDGRIFAMFDGTIEMLVKTTDDELRVYKGSDLLLVSGSSTATDGNWHHAVYTFDGTNHVLYQDGEIIGTSTTTPDSGTISAVIIGDSGFGQSFAGEIDEARLYNRALSPAEVKALYNWAPGPLIYFSFDENQGTTTAYDRSGNGSNATLNSATSASWVPGKFGSALNFNGSNQDANFTTPSNINTSGDSQGTISFWARPSFNSSNTITRGFTGMSDGTTSALSFAFCGNDVNCALSGVGNAGSLIFVSLISGIQNRAMVSSSDYSWNAGDWVHLTITWDDTATTNDMQIYVNGVKPPQTLSNEGGLDISALNTQAQWYIAEDNATDGTNFLGFIDDFRWYNYVRTPQKIVEDMNAGHPTGGSPIGTAVSHWEFDECSGTTAYDRNTASANNLTLTSASWTPNGKFGCAFNGTGSTWLSISDNPDFDFAAVDDFSISMWFRSDSASNPGGVEYLLAKTDVADPGYLIGAVTGGEVYFAVDDDVTWSPLPDAVTYTQTDVYDNTWHHIVATKTGTTRIDLYLDGKLEHTETSGIPTGTLANGHALRIADVTGIDNGNEFNGDIDEVKIYRSALTADQVGIVYNANSATSFGVGSDAKADIQGGAGNPPIVWLPMDENTGTTLYDKTGNGFNGTLASGGTRRYNWSIGKVGSGIYFGGTDNDSGDNDYAYIQFANDAFDSLTQGSIAFWFKPDDNTEDSLQTMFNANVTGTGYADAFQLSFDPANNDVSFWTNGCVTQTNHEGDFDIPGIVTDWHYLVYAESTTGHTFYIDGNRVTPSYGAGNASGTCFFDEINSGTTHFTLGQSKTGTNTGYELETFYGAIDDFKIYDYPLTASQVAYDYNRGEPIAWYKFDECTGTTAFNNAKNGNGNAMGANGTITIGGSGSYTATGTCGSGTGTHAWNAGTNGKINGSLGLDGTNDIVSITDPGTNSFLDLTSFTIGGWFYWNGYPGSSEDDYLIVKGGLDDSNYYLTWANGTDELICGTYDAGLDDGNFATYNMTPNLSQWYHIMCAFDDVANTMSLYLDGQLLTTATSQTINPTGAMDNDPLKFGENDSLYANILLDDIRIYNYPLSPTQIQKVMLGGKAGSAFRFGPDVGSP